jgi:hypothetical protein
MTARILRLQLHLVVEIVNGPLDGNRLLDVQWEGKAVMMFTADIRERGERLRTATEL